MIKSVMVMSMFCLAHANKAEKGHLLIRRKLYYNQRPFGYSVTLGKMSWKQVDDEMEKIEQIVSDIEAEQEKVSSNPRVSLMFN